MRSQRRFESCAVRGDVAAVPPRIDPRERAGVRLRPDRDERVDVSISFHSHRRQVLDLLVGAAPRAGSRAARRGDVRCTGAHPPRAPPGRVASTSGRRRRSPSIRTTSPSPSSSEYPTMRSASRSTRGSVTRARCALSLQSATTAKRARTASTSRSAPKRTGSSAASPVSASVSAAIAAAPRPRRGRVFSGHSGDPSWPRGQRQPLVQLDELAKRRDRVSGQPSISVAPALWQRTRTCGARRGRARA